VNQTEFARLCGLSTRTLQRYVADGRLAPISTAGRVYYSTEQIKDFSPKPNRGRGGKIWIPRVSDGLSTLTFVRRTIFKRELFALKGPPKKPWSR
jgi:predicted site-specific integrase-resolvase